VIEELKEMIKCKDQRIENDQEKCTSLNNTIIECKKQIKCIMDALECEKSKNIELGKQVETYT